MSFSQATQSTVAWQRRSWSQSTSSGWAPSGTVTSFLQDAQTNPIGKNSTPEGRKENRRIEIILLPDLSELPTLPEDMAQASQTKDAEKKPEK